MSPRKHLIIDIKGNSHNDGPGIRSVVFLKGCPLDCIWCQNPESKSIAAELWWESEKCIDCGDCIVACPEGAISRENPRFIDRSICKLCFSCVEVCPSKALRRAGDVLSMEEIVGKVVKYKAFFDRSCGGVTVSGGEPTLPMEFTSALLKRFKEEGIHTLLETSGMFNFSTFESQILPFVDMIYFDIKLVDPLEHRRYCGVTNELILENFIRLHNMAQSGQVELLPRTPLIPGITDTEGNIHKLTEFYNKHGVQKAALLSNNPVWIQKLTRLGQEEVFSDTDPVRNFYAKEKKEEIKAYFSQQGIELLPM